MMNNPILTVGISEAFPQIAGAGVLEVSAEVLGLAPAVMPMLLPYEQLVLAGLVRLLQPCRLLEIGMARGLGTYVLAANSAAYARVVAVDLPQETWNGYTRQCLHQDTTIGRIVLNSCYVDKVFAHLEDSTKIDPDEFRKAYGPFDFVLIDGNHAYEAVVRDTELAHRVVSPDGLILWHDLYSFLAPSPERGVFKHLLELVEQGRPVRHIAGTYFGALKGDWTGSIPGYPRTLQSSDGPFGQRIVRLSDADRPFLEWHEEFLGSRPSARAPRDAERFDLDACFDVALYAGPGDSDLPDPLRMRHIYQKSLYHVDDRAFGPKLDAFGKISDEARQMAETVVADLSRPGASAQEPLTIEGRVAAARLDRMIDEWLLAARHDFFAASEAARGGSSRMVAFVLTRISHKAAQQAAALRREGWRCFLLALEAPTSDVADDFRNSFDAIAILPGLTIALIRALHLARFPIVHYHASMFDYVVGKHIRAALPDTPMVTEFDDISSVYAARPAMRSFFNPDIVDLDLLMEGALCRDSNGVLNQFDPGIQAVLREKHGGLARAMTLQPIWDEPAADSDTAAAVDPHRLVFAGAVLPMGNPKLEPLFPSYGFLGAFEVLAEQGLSLEILLDPGKAHDLSGSVFAPYHALARFAHVRFGKGVARSALARRIGGFGFGIVLMRYDFEASAVTRDKLRFALPNKTFSYLAAGLPVLVSAEFEALARLVEDNGLGLAFRSDEIGDARRRIDEADYAQLRRNVADFRRRFAEINSVHHLIGFYESLRSTTVPVGRPPASRVAFENDSRRKSVSRLDARRRLCGLRSAVR